MRAGTLDRRITLLRRSQTRNAYGEQVETFTEYATVWGQRLDVTGREMFASKGTIAENSAQFRLRYRSDVLYTDRLQCDGVEYDIVQVAELGRRDGLDLVAVARMT